MSFYCKCPICGWISNELGLANVSFPCPHCKKPANLNNTVKARLVFPHTTQHLLLRDVEYFYQGMKKKKQIRLETFIAEIKDKYGYEIDEQEIRSLYKNLREITHNKKGTSDEDIYWEVINEIRKRFPGIRLGDAEGIWVKVSGLFEKEPERKAVVILTCTLIESFFFDLLVEILQFKGVTYDLAYTIIDSYRNKENKENFFKKVTGETFCASLKSIDKEKFYQNWEEIRKKRNNFIHKGMPYSITNDDAEQAYVIACESVAVFAGLHNRFCVKNLND